MFIKNNNIVLFIIKSKNLKNNKEDIIRKLKCINYKKLKYLNLKKFLKIKLKIVILRLKRWKHLNLIIIIEIIKFIKEHSTIFNIYIYI